MNRVVVTALCLLFACCSNARDFGDDEPLFPRETDDEPEIAGEPAPAPPWMEAAGSAPMQVAGAPAPHAGEAAVTGAAGAPAPRAGAGGAAGAAGGAAGAAGSAGSAGSAGAAVAGAGGSAGSAGGAAGAAGAAAGVGGSAGSAAGAGGSAGAPAMQPVRFCKISAGQRLAGQTVGCDATFGTYVLRWKVDAQTTTGCSALAEHPCATGAECKLDDTRPGEPTQYGVCL